VLPAAFLLCNCFFFLCVVLDEAGPPPETAVAIAARLGSLTGDAWWSAASLLSHIVVTAQKHAQAVAYERSAPGHMGTSLVHKWRAALDAQTELGRLYLSGT
jgi:hypothetical protein